MKQNTDKSNLSTYLYLTGATLVFLSLPWLFAHEWVLILIFITLLIALVVLAGTKE